VIRRFLALLGIGLTLAWVQPANAISIVKLGKTITTAATTGVITTITNDCPVGSTIVLFANHLTVADTLSSVADSGPNTWQAPVDETAGTGTAIAFAYAKNTTVDIPIGGTITATFAGATNSGVVAACISGASTTSPLDVHNNTATGLAATSATTVNTGTLSQATEVVIGFTGFSGNPSSTNACNGSYTRLDFNASATGGFIECSLVVASTASVAYSPTWTNSVNYVTNVISFQAPIAVTNSNQPFLTTGVAANDNHPAPKLPLAKAAFGR
jgi:hypothetical protein